MFALEPRRTDEVGSHPHLEGPLTVEERAPGNAKILTPVMESVDVNSLARFLVSLEPTLESGALVVLDLSRVEYMDSAGLGGLVSAHRTARTAGGDLVVTDLTPGVRTIFEMVQLHRVIRVFNHRAEALRALTR